MYIREDIENFKNNKEKYINICEPLRKYEGFTPDEKNEWYKEQCRKYIYSYLTTYNTLIKNSAFYDLAKQLDDYEVSSNKYTKQYETLFKQATAYPKEFIQKYYSLKSGAFTEKLLKMTFREFGSVAKNLSIEEHKERYAAIMEHDANIANSGYDVRYDEKFKKEIQDSNVEGMSPIKLYKKYNSIINKRGFKSNKEKWIENYFVLRLVDVGIKKELIYDYNEKTWISSDNCISYAKIHTPLQYGKQALKEQLKDFKRRKNSIYHETLLKIWDYYGHIMKVFPSMMEKIITVFEEGCNYKYLYFMFNDRIIFSDYGVTGSKTRFWDKKYMEILDDPKEKMFFSEKADEYCEVLCELLLVDTERYASQNIVQMVNLMRSSKKKSSFKKSILKLLGIKTRPERFERWEFEKKMREQRLKEEESDINTPHA